MGEGSKGWRGAVWGSVAQERVTQVKNGLRCSNDKNNLASHSVK